MQKEFGELRSLLSHSSRDDAWRVALWNLIDTTATREPEAYLGLWPSYLEEHAHLFSEDAPLATLSSIAELERAARLVPGAKFALTSPEGSHCSVFAPLSELPLFERVVALDLHGFGAEEVLPSLLTSPHCGSLSTLSVRGFPLDGRAFDALLRCQPLAPLRALTISACELQATFYQAHQNHVYPFASSPLFAHLHTLDLSHNQLDAQAISQLMQNPALATLRRLDLHNNIINATGLHAIATSPHLAHLERLDLSHNALYAFDEEHEQVDGYAALLTTTRLPALTHLDLSHNPSIHKAQLDALDDAPASLPSLKSIKLTEIEIVEEGILEAILDRLKFW